MNSNREEDHAQRTLEDGMGNADSMTDRVVIQFGDRIVKGFTDGHAWNSVASLDPGLAVPCIRLKNSDGVDDVPLEGVKALFFVRTFEGKGHDALRFHDHLPAMECLWVRVTFQDGEVIEGLIRNTSDHVLQPGFYMSPTDPDDNNWMIYVFKRQLKRFEVLGLRASPQDLPMLKLASADNHDIGGKHAVKEPEALGLAWERATA